MIKSKNMFHYLDLVVIDCWNFEKKRIVFGEMSNLNLYIPFIFSYLPIVKDIESIFIYNTHEAIRQAFIKL